MSSGKKQRRWLRWAVAAIAVAGLVWLAVPRLLGPRVDTVQPWHGPVVQSIVTSGRVRPPGRVTLAPLVAGRVASIAVEEGSEVTAGTVVLELDDAEARNAVEQARARLDEVVAQGTSVRTTDARGAAEAVRAAKTRLRDAQRTHERIRTLFDQNVASQEMLDQTNTALALAESELRAAELQVRDVRGTRTARVEATHRQAEAALAAAELRLAQHQLTSPFDGIVIQRGVEVGDIVQPGTMAFIEVRRGETEIVVEPDERNLALLEIGQSARTSAEAFPDQDFEARVVFIAPSVDPRRGTIEVRLRVPEPPPYLKPDMTVSVEIIVGERSDALLLPPTVIRDLSRETPWVLAVEDGRAVRRDLEIGIRGTDAVEVLSGIESDHRLVDGSVDVEVGARVRPIERGP